MIFLPPSSFPAGEVWPAPTRITSIFGSLFYAVFTPRVPTLLVSALLISFLPHLPPVISSIPLYHLVFIAATSTSIISFAPSPDPQVHSGVSRPFNFRLTFAPFSKRSPIFLLFSSPTRVFHLQTYVSTLSNICKCPGATVIMIAAPLSRGSLVLPFTAVGEMFR